MKNDVRKRLGKAITKFYDRLSITDYRKDLVDNLGNLDIILCEHQIFFPHTGIYRLPIMAEKHYCDNQSIVLFIVNDLFYKRNHYTTRHMGIYSAGESYMVQKNPVVVNCDKFRSLNTVKAPSRKEIDKLYNRVVSKYELTYNWIKRLGGNINKKDLNSIKFKINKYFELIKECSNLSYSEWCALIHHKLYAETNPENLNRILFVFNSDIQNEFTDIVERFDKDHSKFTEIINHIFFSEDLQKDIQDRKSINYPFWHICKECGYRNRALNDKYQGFIFQCEKCKSRFSNMASAELSSRYLDAVGKQTLASFFEPKLRIVGGIKPYSIASDLCSKEIYNLTPPERKVLSSFITCHTMSTPEVGASDQSALAVLFETNSERFGRAILSDNWDKNIEYITEFSLKFNDQ